MNKALGALALLFIFGGLGLGLVAIATSNWVEDGDTSFGFFQSCAKYPGLTDKGVLCYINLAEENVAAYKDNEWYLGSVGAYCGGILFGFVGMVLWFSALCSHRTGIRAGAILTLILSFAGLLVGIILWKFKYAEDQSEGYSFWVAVGAAGSMGIATILSIIAAIAHRKK